LCRQISAVLPTLIHCKHGLHEIFPGAVSGAENHKSEKPQWMKGINILVARYERLFDGLENTESLDLG